MRYLRYVQLAMPQGRANAALAGSYVASTTEESNSGRPGTKHCSRRI
jgi:hypothetical protein